MIAERYMARASWPNGLGATLFPGGRRDTWCAETVTDTPTGNRWMVTRDPRARGGFMRWDAIFAVCTVRASRPACSCYGARGLDGRHHASCIARGGR